MLPLSSPIGFREVCFCAWTWRWTFIVVCCWLGNFPSIFRNTILYFEWTCKKLVWFYSCSKRSAFIPWLFFLPSSSFLPQNYCLHISIVSAFLALSMPSFGMCWHLIYDLFIQTFRLHRQWIYFLVFHKWVKNIFNAAEGKKQMSLGQDNACTPSVANIPKSFMACNHIKVFTESGESGCILNFRLRILTQ